MKTELSARIIGNLGQDSSIKQFENGNRFLTFNVAHNESFVNQKGEKVDKTTWINVLYPYKSTKELKIEKGCVVIVEGNLSTKLYTDSEKQTRISTTINANYLKIIGKLEKKATETHATAANTANVISNEVAITVPVGEDDLPF